MGPEASELSALERQYPLSSRWSAPELFTESVNVDGLVIDTVGLLARASDGAEATGSAAEVGASPLRRAYFELLERTSTLDAVATPRKEYELRDASGAVVETCDASVVFPAGDRNATFRYSLSNGVASRPAFSDAARAALEELVERDRVLRSWFGEAPPERTALPVGNFSELYHLYQIEAFVFPSTRKLANRPVEVAAVFGFPKQPTSPLLRGTAGGRTREEALIRAARECLHSLGFLWGESIPKEAPDFAATALYHQEFFLWPDTHHRIRNWLAGGHRDADVIIESPVRPEAWFADLTPEHLAGRCFVLKAVPGPELPLVFGTGHPRLSGPPKEGREVHPLS